MKLNDPFGRMARRNEREYESLAKSLQEAGMTDPAQAEQLLTKLDKRTRTGLTIIVPAAAILALLFPAYWMFTAAFALLICIWLVKTTQKARLYIRRYVAEYLTPQADNDAGRNSPAESNGSADNNGVANSHGEAEAGSDQEPPAPRA